MKRVLGAVLLVTLAAQLFAADAAPAAPAAKKAPKPAAKKSAGAASADGFKNDDQRTAYAYGYKVGQNLAPLGLNEAEISALAKGLREAAGGKPSAVNMALYLPKVGDMIQAHMAAKVAPEKKKGAAFADKFAKEEGVKPIQGGGYLKMLTEGNGAQPSAEDTVKVNYEGTLIDGTKFDSSYDRGEPATFPLNRVIPCWTNGVAMMKVGGKAKLVCPSDVAYGDQGHPPTIPGGSTLIFTVELLDVTKAAPSAPAAPAPKSEEKKPK